MKKIIVFIVTALGSSIAIGAHVTWTAVFDNVVPRSEKVTMQYCLDHTPTVMVTTVDQVLSKEGAKTLNGLRFKYHS